jgi:hypothetical protein
MKHMGVTMNRKFIAVVIGFFAVQPVEATTVSQVINNLRNQNFSQQTLDSIENLLDRFVDQNDRLNADIAPRSADRKILQQHLSKAYQLSSNDEFDYAIRCVQNMLNFTKESSFYSGPMSVFESAEYNTYNALFNIINYRFPSFCRISKSTAFNYIAKFLSEISGKNVVKELSPKKQILSFMQNVDVDNVGLACLKVSLREKLQDPEEVLLHHFLIYRCIIGLNIEECGKSIMRFSRNKTKLSEEELRFAIKKLLFKLCITCETRLSLIEKALMVYLLYQGMFGQVNVFGSSQEFILQNFEEFLTVCLSDCPPKFNKDLSKKTYSIKDYEGRWFGGDDAHPYSSRIFYGNDDEEGKEYPWWVYAPKDTYNRDTVFEYP